MDTFQVFQFCFQSLCNKRLLTIKLKHLLEVPVFVQFSSLYTLKASVKQSFSGAFSGYNTGNDQEWVNSLISDRFQIKENQDLNTTNFKFSAHY